MAHHHHRGIETRGGFFPPHPRGVVDSSGQLLLFALLSPPSASSLPSAAGAGLTRTVATHTYVGKPASPPSLSLSLRLRRRVVAGRKESRTAASDFTLSPIPPYSFCRLGPPPPPPPRFYYSTTYERGTGTSPPPRAGSLPPLSCAVRPMPPACLPPPIPLGLSRRRSPSVRPPSRHGASSPPPPRRISPRRKGPPPLPSAFFAKKKRALQAVSGTGGRKRGSQAVMGEGEEGGRWL